MLEIFAGTATLSQACRRKGVFIFGNLDIKQGEQFDLTKRSCQDKVIRLIRSGLVQYVHVGTSCTVFSIARKGLKNMTRARHRELVSCELAFLTAKLVGV